jgi:hypothetical protein
VYEGERAGRAGGGDEVKKATSDGEKKSPFRQTRKKAKRSRLAHTRHKKTSPLTIFEKLKRKNEIHHDWRDAT